MFSQEAADNVRENAPYRIPSLDGCRAISILLVVVAHLCETPALRAFDPYARLMYHFGPYGVEVFFVISVSSSRLFAQRKAQEMGSISMEKVSYPARFSGIWPVAYAYLLVVAVLAWSCLIFVAPHHFFYAAHSL